MRALSGRELGRAEGVAGPLKVDWAGRGKEERELGSGWFWVELVGSLGVGLGVWAPFLISFLFYFFSFINLNQTKFEFKYKFGFKPHSIN